MQIYKNSALKQTKSLRIQCSRYTYIHTSVRTYTYKFKDKEKPNSLQEQRK